MSKMWYYSKGGTEKQGPVADDEIRRLLTSGALQPSDLVWTEGMTAWVTVSSRAEFQSQPTTFPTPTQSSPIAASAGLPEGLLTWTGFVAVMSIIMGVLNCLSCAGILIGIPLIIAGVALMGAKTALLEVNDIGPELTVFFEKLKTCMLATGIFYILTIIGTVIIIIMYFGMFAAIIAAAGSGMPMD